MKFFDVGQEAQGFIAIGQIATGVIAIGQMATGVIAIGQLARGVVCIGMVSFGLWSVGMLSIGAVWSTGMAGLGGRKGKGFILPLVPRLTPDLDLPAIVALEAVRSGLGQGWVRLKAAAGAQGQIDFRKAGRDVDLSLDRGLAIVAYRALAKSPHDVLAHVRADGGALVCDRLMPVPPLPYEDATFWMKAAGQLIALTATAVAFWLLVGAPLSELIAS